MNEQGKQALIKVAEWLERGAPHVVIEDGVVIDRFDMDVAVDSDSCGTACCVAGAVCQFEKLGQREANGDMYYYGLYGAGNVAREFLGISREDAKGLFEPWERFTGNAQHFSDPKVGGLVIRHYLTTGEVNWDIVERDLTDYEPY